MAGLTRPLFAGTKEPTSSNQESLILEHLAEISLRTSPRFIIHSELFLFVRENESVIRHNCVFDVSERRGEGNGGSVIRTKKGKQGRIGGFVSFVVSCEQREK